MDLGGVSVGLEEVSVDLEEIFVHLEGLIALGHAEGVAADHSELSIVEQVGQTA